MMMPRPKTRKISLPEELTIPVEAKAAQKLMDTGVVGLSVPPSEDAIEEMEKYVLYEAKVGGKSRHYPATTATPRKGKFYGIRTIEDDDRSRILISQKDYNESFPFSDGPVLTKYGIDTGKTCNVTLKLVDVMLDVAAERVIGVYLVVMTPSYAQIDVDAIKLVSELEAQDIAIVKEEVLTHEALMLKFQLEEAMKQAETYRRALFDRDTNIVKLAEDFAAPIIETTIAALSATKDMFEEYYKSQRGRFGWFQDNWKLILGIIAFASMSILLYFYGPWAG
jgi:hypothetical protein